MLLYDSQISGNCYKVRLLFAHLGIDYRNTSFLDPTGRPMPILPYGEPITELL